MVFHSPQTLVPSSTGTTSSGPKALAAHPTWCLTPRKPLFLRRRAPRFRGPRRRRRTRRGASLPANPCSFVAGHHVFGAQSAGSAPDVVLHPPLTLIPPSLDTTSLGPDGVLADAKNGHPRATVFPFIIFRISTSRNPYPASDRYLQPRNADLFLPPSASGNPAGILPRFRPAAGWSAYS